MKTTWVDRQKAHALDVKNFDQSKTLNLKRPDGDNFWILQAFFTWHDKQAKKKTLSDGRL